MSAPCVLVLSGLDPSGGAGLLADAEAVRASGARPLCVATALTVQTTRAARRFESASPGLFTESAHALLEEEDVRAVKIGMIGDAKVGKAVVELLRPRRDLPVVVDPVLQASSGALLFKGSLQAAREIYLELAAHGLITPNLTEAMVLLELQRQPQDAAAVEQAARELVARGSRAALVKGGHLPGDPVDVLAMGQASERFSGARVNVKSRGTGCRLASALAAGLARDRPLRDAVLSARDYVRKVLAGS